MRRALRPCAAGEVRRASPYRDAVNRYLGAYGYHETRDAAPVLAPTQPERSRFGSVLVGVDDSPTSYTAVDHAAIEAELRGWDLRLVHVQHAGTARYPARDLGARLLERMTDRVHDYSPTVAVTSRLVIGSPATMLLTQAETSDLVVVGHRHGLAVATLGMTVGDRVAIHHHGAVLVVRVPGWPPGPRFGSRPIVVGVDASPTSPLTIRFALREAQLRGSELVMLHATGAGRVPPDRLDRRDDVVVHQRYVGGDPVTALVDASGKAAAVIVGRHGGRSVGALRQGSVSRALLQRADCPVFLVA
ncbi:universal stress protein [Jidongwangia harbinensis]|uniref:universal stress protein n=1 Tax=Jidongwangia harbinensis TaxID=2878561 RepID=UPI001CDA1680|nr:universal stress protein [Jidongwangia harbinensis]MCA2218975.1 universal stress protein [Jidongwangia harbinensis]